MATPASELEQTAEISGELLPGYEILSVVGTGGFGTVYRARQLKLDRIVAIKVIQVNRIADAELANRFQTEALALAKFHHPNIVQVFDYGRDANRMYIAMELLEGEDLSQRIQRSGPLDERTVWSIARQTAASLAHALSCGVIHRDVKPANLCLVPTPTGLGLPEDLPMVKVADFGLAMTKWSIPSNEEHHTAPGTVLGTPMYMAPEQFQQSATLDHRADIYALGATIYHALAGRPPFPGASIWDVMTAKLQGPPTEWPAASPGAIALIKSMLAKNPDERPANYDALLLRIDQLSMAHDIHLHHPVAPTHASNRGKLWAALAFVCLLAIASVFAGSFAQRATARHEYKRVGSEVYLFDPAESGQDWDLTTFASGWRDVATDDNGEKALEWEGLILRRLPAAENYQVSMACDIHGSGVSELHFSMAEPVTANSHRLVLRITKSQGAILGEKFGATGDFRPLSEPVSIDVARMSHSDSTYREISITRQGTQWIACFGKTKVGIVTDNGKPKAPLIGLYAQAHDGMHPRAQEIHFEMLREVK